MNQSSIKYHIGRSTIQRWFDKMGNFEKRLKAMGGRLAKQEIQLLRRQLKVLEQQNDILNFALDMVEEESGVDMRKKYLPESLISTKKKGKANKLYATLRVCTQIYLGTMWNDRE